MHVNEFERDGFSVTEKYMTYAECERIYGTSNIQILNMEFQEDAKRATDGNCDQWAMYGKGGITIVTEC